MHRIPREDNGITPLELFSKKIWPKTKLQDLHVWGSPVYVLDSTLADGKKLPCWKRSVYVGISTKHSGSVPLVLNLSSGKITPQYHVVYDDWFQTVSATDDDLPNFEHDDWYRTFGHVIRCSSLMQGDCMGLKQPHISDHVHECGRMDYFRNDSEKQMMLSCKQHNMVPVHIDISSFAKVQKSAVRTLPASDLVSVLIWWYV